MIEQLCFLALLRARTPTLLAAQTSLTNYLLLLAAVILMM